MRTNHRQIRKSKLPLRKYKKEISENSKNSSSEEIIEVGEEKNLYCINLGDNIFSNTKAPITKDNSSDNSNQSKSKSKTKNQTKYKYNSKNKKYETNIEKTQLKKKLFPNDNNISEYEEENEDENKNFEEEKGKNRKSMNYMK